MNAMQRFKSNFKVACTLKLEPDMWFSSGVSNYIRHLALYYQVDAHAMVISIINGVASTCRSTYVKRNSHFLVPCNLYNIVVARSGYSKSSLLDMAELIAETAANFFPEIDDNSKTTEELSDARTTTISNLINKQNNVKNSSKVVFNDGTPAGILSNLKQSTRTMHLHEADVILKSFGLLLPSPYDMPPAKIDPFRSTLMTLYEKPGHFHRVLKNETIDVSGSKLNIFGASTGELLASELVRAATSSSADPLFERFVLWPLDGAPIPNNRCISSIDYTQYCSLEQFAVFCGFFYNLLLEVETDGQVILAAQAEEFREQASNSDIEDNVASKFNKMALVSYRIAGLSAIIEAAFDVACAYVNHYATFDIGLADEQFFNRAEEIVSVKYGSIIRKEQNLIINTEICYRAQNIVAQNTAQYMILMKSTQDDKKNWNSSSGRNMKSFAKSVLTNSDFELAESMDLFTGFVDSAPKKEQLPLTTKQKNMLAKTNEYKKRILFHNSLVFHKTCLYVINFLKKASSILEEYFLKSLVNDGYLIAIPDGLICSKSKATIYIKMIPENENESKDKLVKLLADIGDTELNYTSYMASCKSIWLATRGVIRQEVIDILQQPYYQRLNLDFASFFQAYQSQNQNRRNRVQSSNISSSDVPTLDVQSSNISSSDIPSSDVPSSDVRPVVTAGVAEIANNENLPTDEEDNRRTNNMMNSEYADMDNNHSVESFLNANDDEKSSSSFDQIAVTNEVIIQESEVFVSENKTATISRSNYEEQNVNENSSENERDNETIARRIMNRKRKRRKQSRK